MRRASASVFASGFSQSTCLPARRASIAISACVSPGVATSTRSTSERCTTWRQSVAASIQPNRSAISRACSASRPQTTVIAGACFSGKCDATVRYAWLWARPMKRVPMSATRTAGMGCSGQRAVGPGSYGAGTLAERARRAAVRRRSTTMRRPSPRPRTAAPTLAASPVRIRAARAGDLDTIVAFNEAIATETEGLTLDRARLSTGVAALLADARKGRYWIAERDGAPVGQCMVTFEWSDWRDGDFWWIQSVYVAAPHRGSGVYRALHQEVERAARAEGACGLRLYVEKHNRAAQSVYAKLGLAPAPYDMMERDFVLRV